VAACNLARAVGKEISLAVAEAIRHMSRYALDYFAEPVIGQRLAPTRWLAMMVLSYDRTRRTFSKFNGHRRYQRLHEEGVVGGINVGA
jgi:hypothetical protein